MASEITTDEVLSEVTQSEVTQSEVTVEPTAGVIVFEDPQFEASVASELGLSVGTITTDDMLGLTSLRTSGDISSISGIEYATNLESLQLMSALPEFDDISPLAGLTNLKDIYIGYAPGLSDINPLSGLYNLEDLSIAEAKISDISPISELTNLTRIDFSFNKIEDLSPLTKLTNLSIVQLGHNKISDISPLSGHRNITSLELDHNRIEDISVLAEFSDVVTYLDISSNRITDISPIKDYSALTDFHISNQMIIPEKVVTYTGEEISYTVTDFDGTKITVPLGVPTPGLNVFEKDFTGDSLFLGRHYTGNIVQTVMYKETTLSAIDEVLINEGNKYSDSQLIEIFNAVNSDGFPVVVDQSLIDYDVPSIYQVEFTDEFGNEKISNLVINDIFPRLEIDKSEVAIEVGSKLSDITSQIKVVASELNEGDLNSEVQFDDRAINYRKPGSYQLDIRVADEEGNMIKKSILVVVEEKEEINQETEESIDNGNGDSTGNDSDGADTGMNISNNGNGESEQNDGNNSKLDDKENNDASKRESSEGQLSSTGAQVGLLILIAIVVLLILVYVKKTLNKTKK